MYTKEIFLVKKDVLNAEWLNFIMTLSNYIGFLKKWSLVIKFINCEVHYYVISCLNLPASINNCKDFLLKDTELSIIKNKVFKKLLIMRIGSNSIDIKNYFSFKSEDLEEIVISFRKLYDEKISHKIIVKTNYNTYKLIFGNPITLLSINFHSNYNLILKSPPKYLDLSKSLEVLSKDNSKALLKIDAFPYLDGDYYLDQSELDFAKHSLVLGASGTGKSKFLSLFIKNVYLNFKDEYKIVVIDPHASLEKDLVNFGKVIDFKTYDNSINLFIKGSEDILNSIELMIDVFKSLIINFNAKLERVLRHSLFVLLKNNCFNFKNLRNLLLDTFFRNNIIKAQEEDLPSSVIEFFLTEYNDMKTKYYMDSIEPIISFIDELELISIFEKDNENNLEDVIENNFLTLFSLNRSTLGNRGIKTISGLIMTEIFNIIEKSNFEKIIFIIDEVPVIENNILKRFLAESRKYGLSLMLVGQYFNGVSEELQKAIFANVINYYIFRIAKEDALTLVDNLDMKVPLDDTKERKVKIITNLQNRECLVRISRKGMLLPVFKGSTLEWRI